MGQNIESAESSVVGWVGHWVETVEASCKLVLLQGLDISCVHVEGSDLALKEATRTSSLQQFLGVLDQLRPFHGFRLRLGCSS
jgi:hypothetical protein